MKSKKLLVKVQLNEGTSIDLKSDVSKLSNYQTDKLRDFILSVLPQGPEIVSYPDEIRTTIHSL